MKLLHQLWRSLTHTRALDLSSGYLETLFFESVYRITYLSETICNLIYAPETCMFSGDKCAIPQHSGSITLCIIIILLVHKDAVPIKNFYFLVFETAHFMAVLRYEFEPIIPQRLLFSFTKEQNRSFVSESGRYSGFSTCDRNLSYFIYSSSLKFLLVIFIYCEMWHVFSVPLKLDEVIESFNVVVLQFSALYKYKQLISNKRNFNDLAAAMESPYFDVSTPGRRKILEVWQKRNDLYFRIILGFGTGALLAWHTYPMVDDLEYNLMIPIKIPYDYRTPFFYPLTYAIVLLLFSNIAYFVMLNDLIMQAHVMHLLCQFEVLNDCFRNILQDCCDEGEEINLLSHNLLFMTEDFKQKYIKKIDNLIKQHQMILNNVLTLGALLSGPMLAQLGVSTTIISFIGYQVAMNTGNYTKSLMCTLFLGYNMSVLYIICRWCEEIKTQSEYTGEAVYCSGWERGAASMFGLRSRLMLVITRANKPLVLSAGGMYELSLASYSNIIKTSYSALTLLLRLRHD